MRILALSPKPIHRVQFLNAAKGGGVESQALPILTGEVDRLPQGLDALLVTSDLQGVVRSWQSRTMQDSQPSRLLGEELADVYVKLASQGVVPAPERTGVILAGDLYAVPTGDKRGASGDVRSVWQAFADRFRWVIGVEGNHDRFGTKAERQALCDRQNLDLIDYGTVRRDDLLLGGVSGIMGDPSKPGRRGDAEFLAALRLVVESQPEILVLHQGPMGDPEQRGDRQVTQLLRQTMNVLTICGHIHWADPLAALNHSSQVLNVDCRAVILTAAAG
jgi:3',5'-cyclic-AMP phosphodiesterase